MRERLRRWQSARRKPHLSLCSRETFPYPSGRTSTKTTSRHGILHGNVDSRTYLRQQKPRLTAAVNNTRRVTALALALSALALLPVTAAQAAAPASAPQSCWYNVDDDTMGCFDVSLDPQEQIELATGSELVAVPTGSQQRIATPAAAQVSYLLATGWDTTGQTGPSISYFTTNASICNGLFHSFSTLQTWNNRFESLQAYNGCEAYLYENVNFAGTEFGPITSSLDLGTFKNRAESLIVE